MKGLAATSPDRCSSPRVERSYTETFLGILRQGQVRCSQSDLDKSGIFIHGCSVDRIGRWEEGNAREDLVGARFAASMWICTKAVVCYGQRHMNTFTINKMNSIIEAISWVCAGILEGHDWISEFSLSMQESNILETLNHDIEVPCVVQWEMLWFLRRPVSSTTC